MTTTDLSSLTPKRRRVYMMANQGDAPAEIARKMKITRSAVYSHLRHLKRAGLLPENHSTTPVRAAGNGAVTNSELEEVRKLVSRIREDIAKRLAQASERYGELEQEMNHLKAERVDLMARDDRYKQAEKALAA